MRSVKKVSNRADFMILNAIERFKQECIKKVSLGIAPLTQRDSDGFKSSLWVEVVFSMLYQSGLLYPYRNLGEHKEQYKAVKTQVYLAAKDGFSLKSLAGLLKVNNLI